MSSLHHNTPSLTVIDPRGLTVRDVAYHRNTPQQQPQAMVTCSVFDARGLLQQQWDPRLFELHCTNPGVPPNLSHRHSLSGQRLHTDSVDAGRQVWWLGPGGEMLEQWDSRGAHQRFEYDALLRPVAVFERGGDEPAERCVERLSYAGMTTLEASRNRCGRLIRHDDPAGTLLYDSYAVQGGITGQTRRLRDRADAVDWPLAVSERDAQLQAETFTTTWQYNALGEVLEQVDACGNRQQSCYAVDGLLSSSAIVFKSGVRKPLVDQRSFNASAQVLSERAGNGVISKAEYSELDGRLTRLSAHAGGTVLQDLSYTYDPVGNVLRIRDAAQPTRWASNAQVEAVSTYEYDSLSRLIKASGRENAHNHGTSALPGRIAFGATDDSLWRNYTRHYTYDLAGNLTQMRHVPSTGSGFTQSMRVGTHSNHSVIEREGASVPGLGNGFDLNGNLQALAAGQAMTWNVRNQLARVAQVLRDDGAHDDEVYRYDGAGQRVIKRRVAHASNQLHSHEVVYLPGLELHRQSATGEWLNVLVAQAGRNTVRGLQWQQGRPGDIADEHLRFSLCDHLGSSTLELDETAGLLSQESYYPFGATAWWAAKNAVQANYKTQRYSGKERDASGLYYYGFRYYAPWLLRWVSPDPAGEADGLNLYAMVGNNPMGYVDEGGLQRHPVIDVVTVMVMLVLAGYAADLELTQRTQLAVFGFMLGIVGITALAYEQYKWEMSRNVRRRAYYQQDTLDRAKTLGGLEHLYEHEVTELAAFFLQHRLATADTQSVSYGLTRSARGGVYGYVGPTERSDRAKAIAGVENNPHPKLTRLGFSGMEVRAPARKVGAAPLPAAGRTSTEVQPVTRAAGVTRRDSATSMDVETPESAGPSSGRALQRLVIDVTNIMDELRGSGGEIIRGVIGRLEARQMAVGVGHSYGNNTRGYDLPGYRGQRRRGAYRVLIQHVSGFNYRAVRVMDPHRR